MIVSGCWDEMVRLWDTAGNPVGQPFRGHENQIWSVAFSPDGQTIVSGGGDKTVRLWDTAGNPISQPLRGHTSAVSSVAFSPDGQWIVSSGGDKTVRLWMGGGWQAWLRVCCNRLVYHLVSENPEIDFTQGACGICQKYVTLD